MQKYKEGAWAHIGGRTNRLVRLTRLTILALIFVSFSCCSLLEGIWKRMLLLDLGLAEKEALASSQLSGKAISKPRAKNMPKEVEFASSGECGQCHRDIYRVWSRSVHAQAAVNPTFTRSYREALEESKGQVKELCLTCHAPTTLITKDYELKWEVTREGVSCDVCHSMLSVAVNDIQRPFTFKLGPIKFGPSRQAQPPVYSPRFTHGTKFSELFISPLLCASCHEYRNQHSVSVLSTYSEWESGPYPKQQVYCQSCHMPLVMDNLVDPKIKRVGRVFINTHRMPGGHAPDQLRRALKVEVREIRRLPSQLEVYVDVTNSGAGHMVPTGSPTRKVILEVQVLTDSGRRLRDERVYQRTLADSKGQVLIKTGQMFVEAARVLNDNRIAPRERRSERFAFVVPSAEGATVNVQLWYGFSPHGATEVRFPFYSEEIRLTRR